MFNPNEPRGPDGRWTVGHFPAIHASDLSSGDARRSPEVTPEEFQQYAARGARKYAKLTAESKPIVPLGSAKWNKIVDNAYEKSRAPWGGTTADTHTGRYIPDSADAYAITMRPPGMSTVSVSPDASKAEFRKAMEEARVKYADILARKNHHLGVFHDDDLKRIDIDPVYVTPSLDDVHDIGAFTHAVGGAYHFKSGDGYWPPHVKEQAMSKKKQKQTVSLSTVYTPTTTSSTVLDFAKPGEGKVAFWKQILPMRKIEYTAKDGSRQSLDFTKEYLTDLATNKAVDKIGFLLADRDNSHTMDPERWRGEVAELSVKDDGLYGKIVFPSMKAAKAVLENPDLGVSARIREGVQRSDGTTVPRGIIHVLGTLDPQVSGMSPWQTADLSADQGEVLDLSNEEYADMADEKGKKALTDYTDEDIEKMSDEELDAFLTEHLPEFVAYDGDKPDDEQIDQNSAEPEKVGADMSKTGTADIELANQQVAQANARATEAMRRVAEAEWREARNSYLSEGVPPAALDLAAAVLNRPDDMVIDLSNHDEADVNVSEVVRGLLDSMKGLVDLSAEQGHNGTFSAGDGEDPDKALLDQWNAQF